MLASAYNVDWSPVPALLRSELQDYLLHGVEPASPLLRAILRNDLRRTAILGDDSIETAIPIVRFLSDNAPRRAWGTKHAIEDWREMHGLEGFYNGDPPEDGPTLEVLQDQLQVAREEMKLGGYINDPDRRDRVWNEAHQRILRIQHRIAMKERADEITKESRH